MIRLLVVACLGLPVLIGQTPPPIEQISVGSAAVQAAVLQPYKVRYRETLVNVQQVVFDRARWTDELTRVTQNGRDMWKRHIEVVTPQGAFRETVDIELDAKTLEPIRSYERNPNGAMTLTFQAGKVSGERTTNAETTARSIQGAAKTPFFDYYGGMMDLFLATLPVKAGYRATFPATMATTDPSADPSAIDWPIVEMKGEESVTVEGVSYRAHRAEINTPYGFYRVWVRKEPPFVVRTILLIPPGGRIMYDLIPDGR